MNSQATGEIQFGRNVVITAIANLTRSTRNFALVPFFSTNLSMGHYGDWELLATVIAFATPWISMGLIGAMIRFLPGTSVEETQEGFYSTFIFVLTMSVVTSIVICLTATLIEDTDILTPVRNNIASIASMLISTISMSTVLSYFRAFRQMFSHSTLSLCQHFGEATIVIFLLQSGNHLTSAIWALVGIRTIISLAGLIIIIKEIGIKWPSFQKLKSNLFFSIPLIPNSLFYRLYDSVDRFFLFFFWGSTAVGNYAAIYLAGSLLTTIVSPIHTVFLPTMASFWNKGQKNEITGYVTNIIRLSALITLPFLAIIVVLGEPILQFLTQQILITETKSFIIISLSFAIFGFGIPLGDILVVAGKSKNLFFLNGILAALNFVLNLLVIPSWGITGAAVSTVICHSAYTIFSFYLARSVIPFSLPANNLFKTILSSSITGFFVFFISKNFEQNIFIEIMLGITLYVALLFIFKIVGKKDADYIRSLLRIN